ncbi:MAG TPA: TetR/AcrR family transcriptional regulator [Bradyrhizobium sp.]|nr:TetR/AcrR family transcriptional regulator [Bradyrhizobium sp.]
MATKRKLSRGGISQRSSGNAKGVRTKRRIVLSAIALFNRHGLPNVAVERIAMSLKISPGNLTYHFKRKSELIRATLDELKERLTVALEQPVGVHSAQDGAEYIIQLVRALWDFRFFFNSLAHLLAGDEKLRAEYEAFQEWVMETHVADTEYLVARGYISSAIKPLDLRLLAECVWGQMLHWLRMQQIVSPDAATPSRYAIYQIGMRIWCIWQLWLQPDFSREFRLSFEALRPLHGHRAKRRRQLGDRE